ncbi:hybrid sensor histidine kinase/response regulator [Pandoraea terrae]
MIDTSRDFPARSTLSNVRQWLSRCWGRLPRRAPSSAASVAGSVSAAEDCRCASRQDANTILFAAINHELRVPLQSIAGHLELLAKETLPAGASQRLVLVGNAVDELRRGLDDALQFNRDQVKRFPLSVAAFDLRARLDAEIALLLPTARAKGVALVGRFDATLPDWLLGDADRVMLVVRNLMANAIKFTHDGRVTVRVHAPRAVDEAVAVRISVEDTGIGMSAHEQARLFQAFGQASASIQPNYGGFGLGLWMSQQWVRRMNGTLSVQSVAGEGSCFSFDLTLQRVRAPHRHRIPRTSAKAPPTLPAALQDTRVLVVDDHPMNRLVLAQQLTALGCHVETAAGALQALALAEAARIDVVLTDIRLGDDDGYRLAAQLLQRAKARGARVPRIWAVTGNDADELRARTAGLEGTFIKPVSGEQLVAALATRPPQPLQSAQPVQRPHLALDPVAQDILRQAMRADAGALREAIGRRHAADVAHRLHRIRGGFAAVGASAMVQRCRDVERLLSEGGLPSALRACRGLVRQIEGMFRASATDNGPPPDNDKSSRR